MSAIELPRVPDLKIKEGTTTRLRVIFRDAAEVPYRPAGDNCECFRTNVETGVSTDVTLTYSGAPETGYTIADPAPDGLWLYEWKDLNAGTAVSGDYVVEVTPFNGA